MPSGPGEEKGEQRMTRWFVWKYVLDLDAECTRVRMPRMARFLSLQVQDGQPVMWWDVVPTEPQAQWPTHSFYIVPTGPPGHADDLRPLGTFQLGRFVGHVFTDAFRAVSHAS